MEELTSRNIVGVFRDCGPTVPCHHIREYRYAYGAVEPLTGESFFLVMPCCNTDCMNIFLEELSKAYLNDYILLPMDGASWYKSKGLIVPDNASITLRAVWHYATYNINYNLSEGSFTENATTLYTYGMTFALPTPKRNGYNFGGWYSNENFEGSTITNIQSTDYGHKNFHVKWIQPTPSSSKNVYITFYEYGLMLDSSLNYSRYSVTSSNNSRLWIFESNGTFESLIKCKNSPTKYLTAGANSIVTLEDYNGTDNQRLKNKFCLADFMPWFRCRQDANCIDPCI